MYRDSIIVFVKWKAIIFSFPIIHFYTKFTNLISICGILDFKESVSVPLFSKGTVFVYETLNVIPSYVIASKLFMKKLYFSEMTVKSTLRPCKLLTTA